MAEPTSISPIASGDSSLLRSKTVYLLYEKRQPTFYPSLPHSEDNGGETLMPAAAANDNGRSLEFLITQRLLQLPGCTLSSRASADQLRDKQTIQRINPALKSTLEEAADLIADWIVEDELSGHGNEIKVDRHSDDDDGVADLSIRHRTGLLALSIKHNHDALSHPRPYSLAQWLGFAKGSPTDLDHRRRLLRVSDSFRYSSGGALLFSEVPEQKWTLYKDVCSECVTTLKTIADAGEVSSLFNRLVGCGFKKVLVRSDRVSRRLSSVEIIDYSTLTAPTELRSTVDVRTGSISVDVVFNNGWKIDMRIHNASSRISTSGQLSLKFDAKREYGPSLVTRSLFPA